MEKSWFSEALDVAVMVMASMEMPSEESFVTWALPISIGVLLMFMLGAAIEVGRKSKAGKMGWLVIFAVLFLGVLGFAAKMAIEVILFG